MTLKSPEQLGREAIEKNYGVGSDWEEPNQYGEEGFTRAQAESDIDADEIRGLIEQAIVADRMQIKTALAQPHAVPGFRPHPRPSVSSMIDAYAEWDGEVDTFVHVWDSILAGEETPCSEHPAGIHSTYLSEDSSCDYCGSKNRG